MKTEQLIKLKENLTHLIKAKKDLDKASENRFNVEMWNTSRAKLTTLNMRHERNKEDYHRKYDKFTKLYEELF